MSTSKKRGMKIGAVVGLVGAAAFAVMGSGATTALWSDSASLSNAATITAGNLQTQAIGAMTWSDISKPAAPVAVPAIGSFIVVPGDVLEGTQGIAVALRGNNMNANLVVNLPTPTGTLVAATQGVKFTYSVLNSAGAPIAGATDIAAGTAIPTQALVPGTAGVTATIGSTPAYTVKIKATFDSTTTARTRAAATATLAGATVTLTQVRV